MIYTIILMKTFFFFSSRRRHTRSVSAFLLNRSSDLQNEPQLRDENAHNDKSVHGVLNPTYQAGLRRDAVQPDIEAERKKRDEIEAGKSYCSRRFGGATCDDKSAQIYARFDKNEQICRHRLRRQNVEIGRAVQQECRDRSRMPSSA